MESRYYTEKAVERQSAIELVIIRFQLSEAVFILRSGSHKIKNWKLRHRFNGSVYSECNFEFMLLFNCML
jgi:hypothetical protein